MSGRKSQLSIALLALAALTQTAAAAPVISNVLAADINPTQVTLTWNTDVPANTVVFYGLSAAAIDFSRTHNMLMTEHSETLPNLLTNTLYFYKIKATDAQGSAVTSSTFSFRTAAGNPTAWAFEELFDGAPATPQPWTSPKMDIVVDLQEGQELDSAGNAVQTMKIEASHGPDCGAPIGRSPASLNNHVIDVATYSDQWGTHLDLMGFQTRTRPQLVFQCNNHMMTVVKAGYAVTAFMPRQVFDWTGRTGTFQVDSNVFSFGRSWWDLYIVPADEMWVNIQQRNQGGINMMPKRAVLFSFGANRPMVEVIDNHQIVERHTHWQMFQDAFPNDPAVNDPRIRRTFRFRINQTSYFYEVQKADGSFWVIQGNFDKPLTFSRGLTKIEHHAYNPTKDGINANPWSQWTYHWDNLKFDGPVIPAHTAIEPGPHFIRAWPGNAIPPLRFNVPTADIRNPVLVGDIRSYMTRSDGDPANSTHWAQFRLNGGAWTDLRSQLTNIAVADEGFSFKNPLNGLRQGENIVEFRLNDSPTFPNWMKRADIQEVEIQMDPVNGPADTQAPVISGVQTASIGSSSATVRWVTDEAADTQVEHGLTTGYGSISALDTGKITSHAVALTGLTADTLYHFRVKSRDAAGNLATSGDFTFRTLAGTARRPGDVDRDGDVDVADLSRLLGSFGQTDADANFIGAPTVDIDDLSLLLTHFDRSAPSAQAFGPSPGVPTRLGASLLLMPRARSSAQEPVTVDLFLDAKTAVNALQASLTYPADKTQLLSLDSAGSPFTVQAQEDAAAGTINLIRGSLRPLMGRLKVATLTFANPRGGPALLSFTRTSRALRAVDAGDVLAVAKSVELFDRPASQTFLSPVPADGVNDQVIFDANVRRVVIVDVNGRKVFETESLAGESLAWSGRDERGALLPSGLYIAKVAQSDGTTTYQNLVLVK